MVILVTIFAFLAGVVAGHRLGAWSTASRIEEVLSPNDRSVLNSRIKARFG
jgi:hypothetical protein